MPASSSVPAPVLVRPNAPLIPPEMRNVSEAGVTEKVAGPFSAMPGSVSVPLLLKLSVTVAPLCGGGVVELIEGGDGKVDCRP